MQTLRLRTKLKIQFRASVNHCHSKHQRQTQTKRIGILHSQLKNMTFNFELAHMIDSSLERTFNNVSPTTQFECYQNFQHPTTASLFFIQ